MSSTFDQEHLLGVFVAEALDGMTALSKALNPTSGGATPQQIHEYVLVAHRIKGAAALYGYTGVARLCERLETLCEKAMAIPDCDWLRAVGVMREIVQGAEALVRTISKGEGEDQAVVERCLTSAADLLRDEPCSAVSMPTAHVVGSERPTQAAEAAIQPHEEALPAAPSGEVHLCRSDAYFLPQLDPEVLSSFLPEIEEYLDALEAGLLRVDAHSYDRELIDQLFRTAHTLKGSAYTVGFHVIGDLIHHVEDFMEAVRDSRLSVMSEHVEVILHAIDVVHLLMRRDPSTLESVRRRFQAVVSELRQLNHGLADEAASTGRSVGEIGRSGQAPILKKDHESAGKQEEGRTKEEREVVRVSYARLEQLMNLVGELAIGRSRLDRRLRTLERLSDQAVTCKDRMIDVIRSLTEKYMRTVQSAPAGQEKRPWIKETREIEDFRCLEFDQYDDFTVLARRFDEVSADMTEAMAQVSGAVRQAQEEMSGLWQLTGAMRDEIARARMVPIGASFARFRRAIREAARALDKQVSLMTSGESTEIDAGIAERLVDPLVHLVRNAVYHGIEPPADRLAKGKPAVGTIYLRAAHRGHSIVIEVEDDGAGLNLDMVRRQAAMIGLIRPEQIQSTSDDEALQLIFAPGLSTASKVGGLAGRGIGLDAVKRAVESMRGHIAVESQPDIGTKFTLTLPLTLLITTALLVRAGNERYAIPLSNIREVVQPTAMSVGCREDRAILHGGEDVIEVRPLRQILWRESSAMHGAMPIVVARTATGSLGLAVDELLGRQEIVMKELRPLKLFDRSCFAGATIDSEGLVVLVIDPSRLETGRLTQAKGHGAPSAEVLSADKSMMKPTEGARAAILLIDDSLSVRKFVGQMLESGGYSVDTAVDGADGVKKASERDYSLIITDLEMPRFNGFEVVQALRAGPHTKQTPILVMTTRGGSKYWQVALDVGANSYIVKPVEQRALLDEVGRWLRSTSGGGT